MKQNERIAMFSFLELSVEGLKIKLLCFAYWNRSTCSTYKNKLSVIAWQGDTKILKGGSLRARLIQWTPDRLTSVMSQTREIFDCKYCTVVDCVRVLSHKKIYLQIIVTIPKDALILFKFSE